MPTRLDREIRDEIRFYLEMRVTELEAEGYNSNEAWQAALEAFGNPDKIVAEARGEREGQTVGRRKPELIMSLFQDIRFAVRTLRNSPTSTAATLISLGLGIGANAAIFSFINGLLVRPLYVSEADRLVPVYTSQVGGARHGGTSYLDYLDYRDRNDVFSGLTAVGVGPMAVRGDGESRIVWGQVVSWNYFEVLGVEPVLGRGFTADEDAAFGASPVAVLSFDTWRNQFGADNEILGKTIRINDYPFTVIGVAPPGFAGLSPVVGPGLWAPVTMVEQAFPYTPNVGSRVDPWLQMVGRVRGGLDAAEVQNGLDVLAANMAAEFPRTNADKTLVIGEIDELRMISPEITGNAARQFGMLMAIVGFVLLVACINVANLQLAKANNRRREIALRYSLGASRGRIVRQLLAESGLLAILAAFVGIVVSSLAIDGMRVLVPRLEVPLEIPVALDIRVLGFTGVLAVVTGVLFGLVPALQVLQPAQSEALRDFGRSLSRARVGARLQNTLVIGQLAISVVLLVAAGLFLRSFNNTVAIDPGFSLRNGAVATVNLGYGRYDASSGRELQQRLLERVSALPGVESAAFTAFSPLGMSHGHHDVFVEGYEPGPGELMLVKRNMVSANYFRTMGIPVLSGRAIDERDTEDSEPVAMVNETMARRFWPGADPVGRTVRADLGITFTVVGVIADGKYATLREQDESYLVLPASQGEFVERTNMVVRARGDARSLVPRLVLEVREVAPDLPPPTAVTVPEYLDYSLGSARVPALMIGTFGILALVLASVGLYGVMAYSVSQRTREFGIRLALGSTTTGVTKLVMRTGLTTVAIGIAIGLVLALAVARMLSGVLYGVGTFDPLAFTVAPAVLVVVAQFASYLPARYASSADPVVIMRAE